MQWVSLPLTLTPFLCQWDKRYWSSLVIMVLCYRQYKADLIPSLFQTGDGMHSVCRRHCGLSFSWPSASSSKTFMHQASCFRHTYRDLFSQAFPTHTQPVKIKAVLHNHNDREYFRLSNSPPNSPQKNHRTHIMTTLPCLTHLSLLWNITLIIL